MADPVSLTLAGIGMASSIAGGVVGAEGAKYQGQAQANMYGYQAGVARVNATLAQQDANYATTAGEVEAQTAGMRTRAQVGQTKATIAAGNLDTSSGSGSKVLQSETEIGQFNEATIRANAAKRAYGFNVAGAQDVAQAGAFDVAAATSKTAGDISATSSILGAVGSVSSKWTQANQSFGPSGSGTNLTGPGSGGYSGMGGWSPAAPGY